MNWITRLASEFVALRRGQTGRDAQLRLDTARIFLLTAPNISKFLPLDVSKVELEHLPPFEEQLQHVASHLSKAASHLIMLGPAARRHCSDAPSVKTCVDSESTSFLAFSSDRLRGLHGRRTTVDRPFKTTVKKSSIHNAGLGVYVDGTARAGSLITLYPGITYRPSDVSCMPDYPNVSKNNEYLMWRYDGVIVDGSANSVSRVLTENGQGSPEPHDFSAYAAGQYVNHPPQGGTPNALQYAYDLDLRSIPPQYMPMLPNRPWAHESPTFQTGTAGGRRIGAFAHRALKSLEDLAIRQRVAAANSAATYKGIPNDVSFAGLAVVATQDIQDEEVFINYRFNPAAPGLPLWYEDCDPEESRRRWVQEGFWA